MYARSFASVSVSKVDVNLFYLVVNGGRIGPFESQARCSEEYRNINSRGIKIDTAKVIREDGTFVFTIR